MHELTPLRVIKPEDMMDMRFVAELDKKN